MQQIINQALDLIDSPTLDQHDRPNAPVLDPNAYSVSWLQNALDYYHGVFPWAGIVKSVPVTLQINNPQVTLPNDFLLDVRDGIIIPQPLNPTSTTGLPIRLFRTSLQKFLNFQALAPSTPATNGGGCPRRYMVMPGAIQDVNTGNNVTGVILWPTPDQNYSAYMFYYALPSVLSAGTIPNFPSDRVLVDTVRVQGLEWSRALPLGSANTYMEKMVAQIRRSNLGQEPEEYELPLDPVQFRKGQDAPYAWMGDFSTKI